MRRVLIALLVLLIVGLAPCAGKEPVALKVIAPDLIVESFQFGKFPAGHSPDEVGVKNAKFIPSTVVKGRGFWYGYRIKLRTNRDKVLLWNSFDTWREKPRPGQGEYIKPVDGLLYKFWDIVDGYPPGRHWVKVWIDGVELSPVYYTVEH